MDKNLHLAVIAEVVRDIALLEGQIQELKAVEAYHAAKYREMNGSKNGHAAPTRQTAVPAAPTGKPNPYRGLEQREAAILIMKDAGEPMRSGDVARAMIAGGFEYPQGVSRLSNSLFTSFTRGPKLFKKVDAGLWELTPFALGDSEEQESES